MIIFDGFLRINAGTREYFAIDVLYYGSDISGVNFNTRRDYIDEISSLYFSDNDTLEDSVLFPTYYDNVISGSNSILSSDPESFLVFAPVNEGCCEYLLWRQKPITDDKIVLQVLAKPSPNVVKLGYDGRELPQTTNLTRFNNYTVPPKLKGTFGAKQIKVNEYILWKIDKDATGNFVRTRILTPIGQVNKPIIDTEKMMKKIELLLDPVSISIFINNNDMWNLQNKILSHSSASNLLIEQE